jgi:type IV secretion system protein VirB1
MDGSMFLALLAACAPQVHPSTASAIVAVESGFNPYAIGVVGGELDRQPRSLGEAAATARSLESGGWNYSVGLAQINRRNFARLGLDNGAALDPCRNLAAMQALLSECAGRAGASPQRALRRALSCYYSGNFETGFRDGYVRRVVGAVRPRDRERGQAP